MLRYLPRTLARQAEVIAIGILQARGQSLVVGVPDQVNPHVESVLHSIEHTLQRGHGFSRDLRDS